MNALRAGRILYPVKLHIKFHFKNSISIFVGEASSTVIGYWQRPSASTSNIIQRNIFWNCLLHLCTVYFLHRHDFQWYRVVVGVHSLSAGGTEYTIEKVIHHEEFNKPNPLTNDIALIKTVTPIEFGQDIKPIRYTNMPIYGNQRVWLSKISNEIVQIMLYCSNGSLSLSRFIWSAGWSASTPTGKPTDIMQKIHLTTLKEEPCRLAHGRPILEGSYLCTYHESGGPCYVSAIAMFHGGLLITLFSLEQGDIGSALNHDDKLVGIASFKPSCGSGKPDVFTSLSYYGSWISNTMRKN